ncbi:MAG TPA: type II secretion system protein [Smithellaceae bacterium]|nr:type II secretion system protein [Smithellaceae bacterium]
MSYSQSGKKQGFTLLEIIVVLVILSIVAVGFSDTIFYGVRNYFFSREADQLAQKAQLALARINKELVDAKSISDADMSSVQYKQAKGDEYRIELSENAVNMRGINPQMDARPLIDGLAENNGGKNFLTYYKTGGGITPRAAATAPDWAVTTRGQSPHTTGWKTATGITFVLKLSAHHPPTRIR